MPRQIRSRTNRCHAAATGSEQWSDFTADLVPILLYIRADVLNYALLQSASWYANCVMSPL